MIHIFFELQVGAADLVIIPDAADSEPVGFG
jgi:hypothetical protein